MMKCNAVRMSLACALVGILHLTSCTDSKYPHASPARPAVSQGHGCRQPPPGRPKGPGPSFERKRQTLVTQFDENHDGKLSRGERAAAQKYLTDKNGNHAAPLPFGPPPGRKQHPLAAREPAKEGPAVSGRDLATESKPLYDASVVHTLFLEFADNDWEKQLMDFYGTDIEVPATLRLGGIEAPDVGVRFRGMSSFMMVPSGFKHSLNVSVDAVHENQTVLGARTLNLLNSHEDPTFLRAVLYLQVARNYIPAAKANLVHVVINGHSWGVYVNVEQFNADFIEEWFKSRKGARFKVQGSPMGRGGLEYLGEDKNDYAAIYDLRTKETPHVWDDLIRLCRTLTQTPLSELEHALEPLLDIDGALKFLALENVFMNNDGYWIRASDYNIYQDEQRRYHLIAHDANETFLAIDHAPGSPNGTGPGVRLDPLVGLDDSTKPLRSRLLRVPALRDRYMRIVREIATAWLDWNRLGPIADAHRTRIADLVREDTRKLDSYGDFEKGITSNTQMPGPCGTESRIGLRPFVEQRRAYLLGLR